MSDVVYLGTQEDYDYFMICETDIDGPNTSWGHVMKGGPYANEDDAEIACGIYIG